MGEVAETQWKTKLLDKRRPLNKPSRELGVWVMGILKSSKKVCQKKKKKSVGDRGRETSAETIKRKRGAPWVSGQSQQWP